jgi:hypothetical protein
VRSGCFLVIVKKSPTTKTGFSVSLRFRITQHSRDKELIISLVNYLDCGNVSEKQKQSPILDFQITKFEDLIEKVIPFFQKYPILGVKAKDFSDFCKVAELMQNKAHLTAEGLDQIRKIKAGMNTGRKV